MKETMWQRINRILDEQMQEPPTSEEMLESTIFKPKKNAKNTKKSNRDKPEPRKPKDTFFEEYFKGKK